ncbi:EF-hand domain pair family protein [Theileria parva strain Muguga]|uniref:Membrane-associated calcium-binding protein, putative n=1 Tax=Theileria parva TaxID=5875 RepID=Q4N1P8_THEPA|nr:EF-hand domain pair family protein [Theileria parva strain Muguga]EAN32034.1 EF-hand domain pair family protein [Theileria parva strain Muguga]|eukprot:XP_764317.1 membrane-associated calcium-binding protein [Theileria parva strain Muguga]
MELKLTLVISIYIFFKCWCSVTFENDLKSDVLDENGKSKVDYTHHMLQLFDKIDLNSDGVLSKSELDSFSSKLSKVISDRQLANEMETIDKDKDGNVSLDELLAAFSSEVGEEDALNNKEPLVRRFKVADKNKDGFLDLAELGDLINPSRSPELLKLEVDDVLEAHDSDHDGRISYEEYKKYRNEDGEDEVQSSNDFKQFDKNGDGYLTRNELEDVYKEEEEFDSFTMYDDVTSIVGSSNLTRELWKKHSDELSRSSVTDFQEVLEHPADYGLTFEVPMETPGTVHVEL